MVLRQSSSKSTIVLVLNFDKAVSVKGRIKMTYGNDQRKLPMKMTIADFSIDHTDQPGLLGFRRERPDSNLMKKSRTTSAQPAAFYS